MLLITCHSITQISDLSIELMRNIQKRVVRLEDEPGIHKTPRGIP